MLKIPLNSEFLSKHKSVANNVNIKYKSKYDRKQFRHTECMFLTQDGNKLIYTTCPGVYAIRNWEEVDFVFCCRILLLTLPSLWVLSFIFLHHKDTKKSSNSNGFSVEFQWKSLIFFYI